MLPINPDSVIRGTDFDVEERGIQGGCEREGRDPDHDLGDLLVPVPRSQAGCIGGSRVTDPHGQRVR